tara:strand:- start:47 stop:676 length:630 start_codon:yes stop_codon:yes gene_type:complete
MIKELNEIKNQIKVVIHKSVNEYINSLITEDRISKYDAMDALDVARELNYGGESISKEKTNLLSLIIDNKKPTFTKCISVWFDSEYKEVSSDIRFSHKTNKQKCKALYDVICMEGYKDIEQELIIRLIGIEDQKVNDSLEKYYLSISDQLNKVLILKREKTIKGNNITLYVKNMIQKQTFNLFKEDVLSHLRNDLKNFNLTIDAVIVDK